MKYMVEVGYMTFGPFESATTAVNFAELAKNYSVDVKDVTVKVIKEGENE